MPRAASLKATLAKATKKNLRVFSGSAFDREYDRLNEAQRRAVETIEGPVLVVAGPGTGKTHVVAMRVANILKRTQMRPSNILCLTFSVSGATAMRERLRSLIGSDAYGVTVSTIHSFCDDLIKRYPDAFTGIASLEHASDVTRYQFLNELIDALPVGSVIVSPKDRYSRTGQILSRISQLKREGIDLKRLQESIATFRREMEEGSMAGTKVHERNLRTAQQHAEFVALFAGYERLLRERSLYDYDDMIRFAVGALVREEWLRSSLQVRYQYVLVDEFQDLNGIQHEFLRTLTTLPEGLDQQPNLFVVGDDDQAIYRFQGASVTGMVDFRNRFPACPVITLTASYRSTQPILDAASALIEANQDRIARLEPGIKKTLVSAVTPAGGPKPLLLRPASDGTSGLVVAERIERLIAEGVPPSDIAILTRTNAELFGLADQLSSCGIAAQITGKLDLMRNERVLQCISLLRAVAAPGDDHTLGSGLACQCFGCHPADLGSLWTELRRLHTEKDEGAAWTRMVDLLLTIDAPMTDSGLQLRNAAGVVAARDLILTLSERQSSMTLPALLDTLLRGSGLIPADPEELPPADLIALKGFFTFVSQRSREEKDFSLQGLLKDLRYRTQYNLTLEYDAPHVQGSAVQLLTAHGAKGLEFEVVIVEGFREKHWDHKRSPPALKLPDHLLGLSREEDRTKLEDERRLAYVAWTRAKRHLLFVCPERMSRGEREQAVSPSQFFAEGGALPEERCDVRDQTRLALLLAPRRVTAIDEQLKTFLRRRLETYEFSITALNAFLSDPERFLWEELLESPRAVSPALAYGSAVHSTLQHWAESARRGSPLPLSDLLSVFTADMERRQIFTAAERAHWLHLGERVITRYHEERLRSIPLIHSIERRLTAKVGSVPIKGFLDRIDLLTPDGSSVHVIDYKTGSPKTERQIREDDRGALYRQLAFYKILVENAREARGFTAAHLSLDFLGELEAGPKMLTFQIPASDIAALRDLIARVWAKIVALDFTPV